MIFITVTCVACEVNHVVQYLDLTSNKSICLSVCLASTKFKYIGTFRKFVADENIADDNFRSMIRVKTLWLQEFVGDIRSTIF